MRVRHASMCIGNGTLFGEIALKNNMTNKPNDKYFEKLCGQVTTLYVFEKCEH